MQLRKLESHPPFTPHCLFEGATGLEFVVGVMKAYVKTVEYLMASGLGYIIVRLATYTEI
jgi:hypothetical protein